MVNGDLLMNKLDYSKMSRQELRSHILANREDDDAIAALIQRADPNAPTYPYPQTEADIQAMADILKQQLSDPSR
jgi:hypothetical protein